MDYYQLLCVLMLGTLLKRLDLLRKEAREMDRQKRNVRTRQCVTGWWSIVVCSLLLSLRQQIKKCHGNNANYSVLKQ